MKQSKQDRRAKELRDMARRNITRASAAERDGDTGRAETYTARAARAEHMLGQVEADPAEVTPRYRRIR